MHAVELLGELQAFVIVRADGENGDDGRRIFVEQLAQQDEEAPGFVLCLGEEQLLALVDRYDQRRRLWRDFAIDRAGRRLVGERLQERLELGGAAIDGGAHVGARHLEFRRGKGVLERGQQAPFAGDRRRLRTDDRQGEEVGVVARQPRQKTCTQERRFAGARGAEDDEKARWRRLAQAAQPV